MNEDFIKLCNLWKDRDCSDDYMCDVYDSEIWKKWKSENYFSNSRNLALFINIDWLTINKRNSNKLGLIFAAVLNLPRHLRFQADNVALCAIIPGPDEPELHINTY